MDRKEEKGMKEGPQGAFAEKLKQAIDSGEWEPDIWKEDAEISQEELQDLLQKITEKKKL